MIIAKTYAMAGVLLALSLSIGFAQSAAQPPALITEAIDETNLVTLEGNTRPEANARNDRGPVADGFRMEHMFLQLRRSPEREHAIEEFIGQLTDPKSPNYHHWLTAREIGDRYGLAQADMAAITGWLKSHGFAVNAVYPNGMVIDFSGTAGQVREAFHTGIHRLDVSGTRHIANMSDPQIPAAFAPAVVGVVSLHDFRPRATNVARPAYTVSGEGQPEYLMVPADLATIYNLNPLFSAGISGQGQTVVVIEDSNLYNYPVDWNKFRSTFGLADAYPEGSLTQVHPGGCSSPGVNSDDGEGAIDAEWASAAAPSATIEVASCADTASTFGGFIALTNLLSSEAPPAIVSISYLESEPHLGAAGNAYVNSLYQTAATEGVSVFVAAGDNGAATSDDGAKAASDGITVNGFASTPYDVAVGGTDFSDTYSNANSTYWSASNGANYGSALSYVPEIPWNDSCASVLIAQFVYGPSEVTYGASGFCNDPSVGKSYLGVTGGSGGPSRCATGSPSISGTVSGSCAGYPKPSWQSVLGNPSDGVRDLPDVSLFAGNGVWGHYYVVCYSDPAAGDGGASCAGAPYTWSGAGGTSFSAPIMAGIQSLANQSTGSRQGNPNPLYYSLAQTEYGVTGSASCDSTLGNAVDSSCIFYDVTEGDIDQPCVVGKPNCFSDGVPKRDFGVLSTSTSSYQPAYPATMGWDFATGIGTVNAYNLVMAAGATPVGTASATPSATPTPVSEKLKVSPTKFNFGKVPQNTPSKPVTVTIKNAGTGRKALPVIVETESAAPTPVFAVTSECNTTLEPGKSCKVKVTCTPTDKTLYGGSLTIDDNATGARQYVTLSCTGK